jgi:hypothetical protein
LLKKYNASSTTKCCESSAASGNMDWDYAAHGKEYRSTNDETDPFDKFWYGKETSGNVCVRLIGVVTDY